MAFEVSKRKLNLGTANTDAIVLPLFNSLFSLVYHDRCLFHFGFCEQFCVKTTGSLKCQLANWLPSF